MIPQAPPTKLFSAAWQSVAISAGGIATFASCNTAIAVATSIEADELNPAFSGTSPLKHQANSRNGNAMLPQQADDASRVVAPVMTPLRRERSKIVADTLVEVSRGQMEQAHPPVLSIVAVVAKSIAIGITYPPV